MPRAQAEEAALAQVAQHFHKSTSTASTVEVWKPDQAAWDTQAEEAALAQVAQPFHTGEATGLDGCARRPVLATCSLDRTVRIWNTQDRRAMFPPPAP